MTNYGPEEYFIQAIRANFQARTDCPVVVDLTINYTDGYRLTVKFPSWARLDGEEFIQVKTVEKEKLMADPAQAANETLEELVDWFMTQQEERKWLDQPIPKKEDSDIDVAEIML